MRRVTRVLDVKVIRMTTKKNEVKLPQLIDAFLTALLNEVENRKISTKNKTDMIRSTVAHAFKKAGLKMPAIPDEVLELRDLLGRETDRGCALSAAAFLDHANKMGSGLEI